MSSSQISEEPTLIVSRAKKGYDYIRKSILGHGTFGSVELYLRQGSLDPNPFCDIFLSEEKFDNEYCAIKTYKKFQQYNEGLGVQISSLREISLLMTINHPNLLSAHEVTAEKDELRVIMDFQLQLLDVYHDDFIMKEERNKKLVCYQLIQGLYCLHKNYIFHRDLKPTNVFVSKDGVVKIGDFGFSKEFGSPKRKYTPNVCTVEYRAPQLFFSSQYYTEKTDIWSLGCIFYTIFTGETLFESDRSDLSTITKIFSITGTPTKQTWPDYERLPIIYEFKPYPKKSLAKMSGISEQVCRFIEQCLRLDPKTRPSAKQLLEDPFFSDNVEFYQNGKLGTSYLYHRKLEEALNRKMQ